MKTAVEIALEKGYAVNPGRELTVKEAKRLTLNLRTARETFGDSDGSVVGTSVWVIVGFVTGTIVMPYIGMLAGMGILLVVAAVPTVAFFSYATSLQKKQGTTFRLIHDSVVTPAPVRSVPFQKLQKALSQMEFTAADSIKTDIISDLRHLQWDVSVLENSRRELKIARNTSKGLSPSEESALVLGLTKVEAALNTLSERVDVVVDNVAALPTVSDGSMSKVAFAAQAVEQARRITSSDTGTGSLELTAVYRQAWEQG